ncbi:hypothetical protein Dimus_031433 [Dionaea muscipula]
MAVLNGLHPRLLLISLASKSPTKIRIFNSRIPHPPIPCDSLSLLIPPLNPHPLTPSPRAAKPPANYYDYPDPIPEFAIAETQKFEVELRKKLMEDRDISRDELDKIVTVCSEVLNVFLEKEYGGPGTLLVDPFTYMFVALKYLKLPGAALAARASLLWAQRCIDRDWEIWRLTTSNPNKKIKHTLRVLFLIRSSASKLGRKKERMSVLPHPLLPSCFFFFTQEESICCNSL